MEEEVKLGRPTKFNDSLKEKMIQLAKDGKTEQQIAEIIGVCVRTIANWKGKHPELLHALNEAKQVADELVEASLFARAVGFRHKAVKVFCHEGQVTEHEYVEQYPPDTTAAMFWLRNRQPDKWRSGDSSQEVNINISLADKLAKARSRAK